MNMRPNLLILAAAMRLSAAAPCPCADVQLSVSDLFGDPVSIGTLRFVGESGDAAARFSNGRAKLVPYGRYEVTVIVPGFEAWHRDIEIHSARVIVPVGMETGGIEAPPRLCSIGGRVVPGARPRWPLWVRAQAVFGYQSFATALNANRFNFENIPCGTYLFIIVSGADVVATTSTVITPDHKSIDIAVGGAVSQKENRSGPR
jgi:hypothetical protein